MALNLKNISTPASNASASAQEGPTRSRSSARGNALSYRGHQVMYACLALATLIFMPYVLFGISQKIGAAAGAVALFGLGFRCICEYGRGRIDGVIASWRYGASPVFKSETPLSFRLSSANLLIGSVFYTGMSLLILAMILFII